MVRGMSREMKEVCRKFQEVTRWRIPVIERAGRSVRSIAKAEPLKEKGGKRQDCFRCTSGGGNCERNRSEYRIKCKSCQLAIVVFLYEGETGKNWYTQGKEHQDALKLEKKENALWKHCQIQQNEEKATIAMKVLGVLYLPGHIGQ